MRKICKRNFSYYIKKPNWIRGLREPVSKNACKAQYEIIAKMEKECNENDTKRG